MSTVTEILTIRLPAAAARRLRRIAEISHRPVDEVVAETLRAGLPPLLEDLPPNFREDLALLETQTTTDLWQQMRTQMDPERLARYDALLETNSSGRLDEEARRELGALRMEADRLMYRKAYAALLLKWRGEHLA